MGIKKKREYLALLQQGKADEAEKLSNSISENRHLLLLTHNLTDEAYKVLSSVADKISFGNIIAWFLMSPDEKYIIHKWCSLSESMPHEIIPFESYKEYLLGNYSDQSGIGTRIVSKRMDEEQVSFLMEGVSL